MSSTCFARRACAAEVTLAEAAVEKDLQPNAKYVRALAALFRRHAGSTVPPRATAYRGTGANWLKQPRR